MGLYFYFLIRMIFLFYSYCVISKGCRISFYYLWFLNMVLIFLLLSSWNCSLFVAFILNKSILSSIECFRSFIYYLLRSYIISFYLPCLILCRWISILFFKLKLSFCFSCSLLIYFIFAPLSTFLSLLPLISFTLKYFSCLIYPLNYRSLLSNSSFCSRDFLSLTL